MENLSRKQQEIQQREQLILDTAANMLNTGGYLQLNMDRIAEAIDYSKGTVYQHFPCKEEILSALYLRNLHSKHALFQKAINYHGRAREKLTALLSAYQLHVKLCREAFNHLLIIKNDSIRRKLSQQRLQQIDKIEQRCLGIIYQAIQEGVDSGDLTLAAQAPSELIFGLWSLAFGSSVLMTTQTPSSSSLVDTPEDIVHQHCGRLLDSYAWQPLSQDWDYEQTRKHIEQTLFEQESSTIGAKIATP